MLYVPQNSYWEYVFNSEWYRFLNIKEFAVDFSRSLQVDTIFKAGRSIS